MATIGSLSVKLGLDPARFVSGLGRARKSLRGFRDGVDQSARDIDTLGKAMSGIGKPAGLAALIGGVVSLTAAVAPASGAMLALPAAAGVAGAAFATLKIGTSGLGDALKALAEGDAVAAEEALAKLAPSARVFARSLNTVRETYGSLKQTVQGNLFAGLGPQVEKLGGTYLPILDKGLGKTATSLNGMAKGAIAAASTPFFTGAVADILDRTTGVLDTLTPAVGALLTSVVALAQGGMPLIESFASWAAGGAQSAAAFLSSAEGAEWMAQKVDQAQRVLQQLWSISKSLTAALQGIFAAATPAGQDLLTTIELLTAKFAAWATSVRGQKALGEMFTTLRELAAALLAILPQFTGALSTLVGWFNALPGPVQSVVASMLAWSLLLGGLVSKFAPLIATLVRLGPVLTMVGGFVLKFGLLLGKLGARALIFGARMAAAWLIAMGPVGWVIAIVVALVALIIANWDTVVKWTKKAWSAVSKAVQAAWDWIRNAVSVAVAWVRAAVTAAWNAIKGATSAVWNAIKSAISSAWNAIKSLVSSAASAVVNFLRSAWNRARSLVSSAWNAISNAVSNGVSRMIGFVRSIPGRILSALGNLGSLLYNAGRNVIQGLINGIKSMISAVGNAIGSVASKIRNALPFSPAKEGPLSGAGAPNLAGQAIAEMLAEGMRDRIRMVTAAAHEMAGAVDLGSVGRAAFADIGGPAATGGALAAAGRTAGMVIENFWSQNAVDERRLAEEFDWLARGRGIG